MLVALAIVNCPYAYGQVPTDTSYFRNLQAPNRDTIQIQVKYVGETLKVRPPTIFHVSSESVRPALFEPFYRLPRERDGFRDFGSYNYSDIILTSPQLASLVAAIDGLPAVKDGDVAQLAVLSLTMVARLPELRGFNSIISSDEAGPLFDALRAVVIGDSSRRKSVNALACSFGKLEAARPTDATSTVGIVFSDLLPKGSTEKFVASARVTNQTQATLPGPISLVLDDLAPGIKLTNNAGATCTMEPLGKPYVTSESALVPGGTHTFVLEFEIDNEELIAPVPRLLVGAGGR